MGKKKLHIQGALLRTTSAAFIFIATLFIVINLSGCQKEVLPQTAGFLNLKVVGDDEATGWEMITSQWNDTTGDLDLEATSYSYARCSIHLKNIFSPTPVDPISLLQFYYTDGIDFLPYSVSGYLVISEADHKAIRGTFNLYFSNNNTAVAGKSITGSFAVINGN